MSPELVAALVATFLGGALTGVIAALGVTIPWLVSLSKGVASMDARLAAIEHAADKPGARCVVHDERIAAVQHDVESLRVRVDSLEAAR